MSGSIGTLNWYACEECKHDNGEDGCEFSDRPMSLEQDGEDVICVEFELQPAEEPFTKKTLRDEHGTADFDQPAEEEK